MSIRDRVATGVAVAFTVFVLCTGATAAYAFDEPHNQPEFNGTSANHGIGKPCNACHRGQVADPSGSADCITCHYDIYGGPPGPEVGKGPHGSYARTSARCTACHAVHRAPGTMLLPGQTVTDTCFTCHDGTGGKGVYGAIAARGLSVGASHSVDTTNVVPGGNGATGGDATRTFSGAGGTLGCDDCHSPHDAGTVQPFLSDRRRTSLDYLNDPTRGAVTNKLLRRRTGGATTDTPVYGSDWCQGCHAGRAAGGAVHNHPVDSSATANPAFHYSNVSLLATDTTTSVTVTGSMGQTNRGFLMPFPRTPQQGSHKPICQQCHANSRDVGALDAAGSSARATTWSVQSTDGLRATDSPRFQTFPHETANTDLLVETSDDLCLNCHPAAALP